MTSARFKQTQVSKYQEKRLRYNSMKLSVWEGCMSIISIGLFQIFLIPFLINLNATDLQAGIGNGLPYLFAGIVKIGVPLILVRIKGYKTYVFVTAVLQAMFLLPIGLLVFYFDEKQSVWIAILLATLSQTIGTAGLSAWSDWMSYLVPRRRRGKYFARRNRIMTLIQVLVTLISGLLLDYIGSKPEVVFVGIWIVAGLARGTSSILITKHYEPTKMLSTIRAKPNFAKFLRSTFSTCFGKFTLAWAMVNFGFAFALPYYPIYMLKEMQLSYLSYSVLMMTPVLTIIATTHYWGKVCDRIGYVMPLRLSFFLCAIPPSVWLVTKSFPILFVNQILSGLGLAGFLLLTFNYMIASLNAEQRPTNISYTHAFNFIAIGLGSIFAGILTPFIPTLENSKSLTIFAISSLIILVSALLLRSIQIDRKVELKGAERFFFAPLFPLRIIPGRSLFKRKRKPNQNH